MKLQFFSDLHLEFGPMTALETDADVIVAAGDVHIGADGVQWLKQSGKPTIYVAGNHEYYGGEIEAVQAAIAAAAANSNVHYLECQSTVINDVRFIGATLWTDFMGLNRELMEQLQGQMNDYQQIRYRDSPLTPADLAALNQHTTAWLGTQLSQPFAGKTVVVTHHAPLYNSWNNNNHALFKGAYCNDLSQLILAHAPDLWIHGHVHACADYHANRLHVVCNPRGYDGYQLVDGFDAGATITL